MSLKFDEILSGDLALEIELDTGARKAAVISEIACSGPCEG